VAAAADQPLLAQPTRGAKVRFLVLPARSQATFPMADQRSREPIGRFRLSDLHQPVREPRVPHGREKSSRRAEQAIRMAASLTGKDGHCGAIAFSRTGDPALGDFEDAVILKTFGEVDIGLLST
jgi:hypothetical protein